jgi:hypothetical protein
MVALGLICTAPEGATWTDMHDDVVCPSLLASEDSNCTDMHCCGTTTARGLICTAPTHPNALRGLQLHREARFRWRMRGSPLPYPISGPYTTGALAAT